MLKPTPDCIANIQYMSDDEARKKATGSEEAEVEMVMEKEGMIPIPRITCSATTRLARSWTMMSRLDRSSLPCHILT